MGKWMTTSPQTLPSPFLLGAISKSNHFPFNAVDDMTNQKAEDASEYGHHHEIYRLALQDFFEAIEGQPWAKQAIYHHG